MRSSWWMGSSVSIVPITVDRKDRRGASLLKDCRTRQSLDAKGRVSPIENDPPRDGPDLCGKHGFHLYDG